MITRLNKLTVLFVFFFILIYLGILTYFAIWNEPNKTDVIIRDTEVRLSISENKESARTTTIMLIDTDKGKFEVDKEGVMSCPELFERIHKGDTLNITYTWFNCPFIGQYRTIIGIN